MTELEALLKMAGACGYLLRTINTGRHSSEIIAGVLHHKDCADVFVFCDEKHAHAYRSLTDTDPFTPEWVYWWYDANPVWALRALLTLPAPAAARASLQRVSGHFLAVPGHAHDQGSVR